MGNETRKLRSKHTKVVCGWTAVKAAMKADYEEVPDEELEETEDLEGNDDEDEPTPAAEPPPIPVPTTASRPRRNSRKAKAV